MTDTQTATEQLLDLHDLESEDYERTLGKTLHDVRESLDERISRDQLERLLLGSEAHPYDLLEALQCLAGMVAVDDPCPSCGHFDCTD